MDAVTLAKTRAQMLPKVATSALLILMFVFVVIGFFSLFSWKVKKRQLRAF
jgi:hypothetical protein